MTDGLNKCLFAGNLGQDPDLRYTNNGTAVMNFSIACNETYFDSNKQKQERVEWVRVVVWGKRAEGLGKFLRKGHRLIVEGRQQTSNYEDRDGNKRYKTEIVAQNIIVEPSGRGDSGGSRRDPAPADDGSAPYDAGGGYGPDDDDIPFSPLPNI